MPSALDLLCFGAFLACFRHRFGLPCGDSNTRRLTSVGQVALVLYILIYFYWHESWVFIAFERTLTALFFGAFIIAAANGFTGPVSWLLGNRLIVWLGMISYGLYIYHPLITESYPVMQDLLGISRDVAGLYYVHYPLMGMMLLLVTSASYYCVERPIRRLRRYFP